MSEANYGMVLISSLYLIKGEKRMDIRKNYAFWCDKNDIKDVCNRVYDLLDKDVVDAKSNTMIVFKNNDCWFFLDIELDDLVRITDFFDASFVKVGYKNGRQLRRIKGSNKEYSVAQEAIYKLDYSNDDNLKKSILIPEYFRDRGVRNLLSRNIGIGCTNKENIDTVREELASYLDVEFYSEDHITTIDGTCIRFFQLDEHVRGCRFREVYIEEGYDNIDFINTCVRPMSYNIYILDIDDVAGSIMNPRRLVMSS